MAVNLLNSKHIEDPFQAAAKSVHGITIKEELKKWASKSIRVEICVLLSKDGNDGPFIKIRLH